MQIDLITRNQILHTISVVLLEEFKIVIEIDLLNPMNDKHKSDLENKLDEVNTHITHLVEYMEA